MSLFSIQFDLLRFSRGILLFLIIGVLGLACSVAEPKAASANAAVVPVDAGAAPKLASIQIDAGGPADTVRAFYKLLREKKFREAIFLTNLKPAIEGLTESELKDFAIDFEAIAGQVPAVIEINGEIISGESATVTANLPNEDGDKNEIQQIKLKKSGEFWVILTVDPEAEARIKKEGKNYFYNLRIEVHEGEAKKMLERISKAELAHALQNGGTYAEFQTLIDAGLLPDDVKSSESTGYIYSVKITDGKKSYFASAVPAVYGKTGRLSFLLEPSNNGVSHVTSKDNSGQLIKK